VGARGPQAKHAQGLTIIGGGGIEAVRRPDPPADLTDEMAEEWRKIVSHLPADFFRVEALPMLAQYCTHIIRCRRLRSVLSMMEQSEAFDPVEYKLLLDAEEKQSRSISSLATRMRLSPASVYDREKKKGPSFKTEGLHAPWE
jgi:hypothetical protein